MTVPPDSIPPPRRAVDPVCGAELEPSGGGLTAPVLFRGSRWWFCSDACRVAFKRAPERHAEARPEAAESLVPAPPPAARRASPFRVMPPEGAPKRRGPAS